MMKTIKYILSTFLVIAVIWSCTDDELNNLDFLDSAVAPTNVDALLTITQDNTGLVSILPSADGAVQFEIEYGDGTGSPAIVKAGGTIDHTYAEGNYTINILAKGITGLTTDFSKDLLVSFQSPVFGTEPVIENDAAVSKQVNVTVADDAQFAMYFDVYFVEDGIETIITGNVGETVSYVYANAGIVDIKVVLKGGAIATAEFILTDFEVVEILAPIVSAAVPVNRDEADYYSIFSGAYTTIGGSDYNPGWGQATGYNLFDLNGDEMLQYSTLNYQGIQIGETINVTAMEYLHVDIWTPALASVDIYPLQVGVAAEDEVFKTLELVAGEWSSFDIPLTFFTDQGLPLDQIHQFKFVGENSGTIFVDNLYFHKTATEFADLPITFDSAIETFEPFLGAEFEITADPEDANNPVGKITNYGAESSWGWEGMSLKLDTWVDLGIIPTIKLDFYNDGAAHKVLLKLEDSTSPPDGDGNPSVKEEVEVDVSNTGWSELVFNFTSGLSYDSVVLFVDGNVKGIAGTFYFDNVVNEEFISLPLTMDTPGQAFEPFLDAEFAFSTDPDDANNSVGMITNHGQGWGWEGVKIFLDEWIDTSTNTAITLDFYNDGVTHDVLMKLEDSTSPLDGDGNPTVIEEVHAAVSNTGWSTLTFDFTSGGSYDTVVIFVDGDVYNITGTYYFDNVMQP